MMTYNEIINYIQGKNTEGVVVLDPSSRDWMDDPLVEAIFGQMCQTVDQGGFLVFFLMLWDCLKNGSSDPKNGGDWALFCRATWGLLVPQKVGATYCAFMCLDAMTEADKYWARVWFFDRIHAPQRVTECFWAAVLMVFDKYKREGVVK